MDGYRHSSRFDWLKAQRVCLGLGADLVSIENAKEMKYVSNLSSALSNDGTWIGLVQRYHKGGYFWSDGTPFNSSEQANWLDHKISNRSKIQCGEISRNGWNITECCTKNRYFICKRPKGGCRCESTNRVNNHNSVNCDRPGECSPEKDCLR